MRQNAKQRAVLKAARGLFRDHDRVTLADIASAIGDSSPGNFHRVSSIISTLKDKGQWPRKYKLARRGRTTIPEATKADPRQRLAMMREALGLMHKAVGLMM